MGAELLSRCHRMIPDRLSDIVRPHCVEDWSDRRPARTHVNRAQSTWTHRTLGLDADASDGDDEFSILIAKVGDTIGKQQLAGAFALALPGLARPRFGGEHFAGTHRAE